MGHIKRVLAETVLDDLPKFWNKTRIEAGEEGVIHFHWRDLRIICWPLEQFESLYNVVKTGFEKWDRKFVPNKDIYVSMIKIPSKILLGDTMAIEEQTNGVIHFHYRDTRLELSPVDFIKMAKMFSSALESYSNGWETMVKLDDINPYDKHHFPTKEEWVKYKKKDYKYHREGIEIVKEGIKNEGQILPIMITEVFDKSYKYQRLDGFKRFMGYKELGFEKMPCFVVKPKEIEKIRQHARSFWRIPPLSKDGVI